MQERLVKVLRDVGVDNLQIFPADVCHNVTNEKIPGYVAVNILSRISCANMNQSNTSPLLNTHFFESLALDIDKTNGSLMFRLHESPMIVLIHEKVANAIKVANFPGLTLEPIVQS